MQCRACMQINCAEDSVDMSSTTSEDGKTLYDYFNNCTQLQANSMDSLPQILCTICTKKLQVAYNFRQVALQSDKQLQRLVLGEDLIYYCSTQPLQQSDELKFGTECTNDPLDLPTMQNIRQEPTMETVFALREDKLSIALLPNSNQEQIDKEANFKTSADGKVLIEDESKILKCRTKLICELCSSDYFTKTELKDHIFHEHFPDIICIKCPKVYEFPHEVQIHESLVHGTDPKVQCLRCNQLIARTVLARHFQKCHPLSYMKYFPRRTNNKISGNNPRIYCEVCQHEFSTILELAKHIRNHKFDCPLCKMSFKKHGSYRSHVKRVHNHSLSSLKAMIEDNNDGAFKTPFQCSICLSKFRLNRTYRLHMKNVHNQYLRHTSSEQQEEKNLYECEICHLLFNYRSARHTHIKRKHQSKEIAVVGDISTTITVSNATIASGNSKKVDLDIDIAEQDSDEGSNDYKKCNICSKKFKCKRLYIKHMNKFHRQCINRPAILDEAYIFECELCNMGFKLRASLYMHRRSKHPEMLMAKRSKFTDDKLKVKASGNENVNNEFIACKYCYKLLPRDKWKNHETNHIYNRRRQGAYLCAYCPREYKYDSALKRHEKTHRSKVNSEPRECPICQKMFKATYLKLHIRRYHNTDRKHICSNCGISFQSHKLLYNHKRLHMERNIPCTSCDKKFIRAVDLKIHMRQHTGEEPFACHLCSQRFKIKSNLIYHLQRHAGIRPQCSMCGKEFTDRKTLKIHSYKHTGMPYKCSVCGYGTALRDAFRKHLLRMHDMHMTNEEYSEMYKANTA